MRYSLVGLALVAACSGREAARSGDSAVTLASSAPVVTRATFGTLPDGGVVEQFSLKNAHGIEVRAMSYGASITSIKTPDRAGAFGDIVFGYDSLGAYIRDASYFGPTVGRFANRIARARFTLDGRTYALAVNDGVNTLHGGRRGLNKALWRGEPFTRGDTAGVTFRYTSPDGEEGYPGTLQLAVSYGLTPNNELVIDYEATTDKPTPVNVSQHGYWNLHGDGRGTILDHLLTIDASSYTPVDSTLIPTGKIAPVDGTPFDFRTPTAIGARIGQTDTQLRFGKGYDHNWVLDRGGRTGLVHAARVTDPTSGRTLDIATTEPGFQFYSGNFLDGSVHGKGGQPYAHRTAIVLETQHFPDSPNHASFPSTILRPGDTLRSRTVFTFGVTR
ncbi:MAG TPA: aldose epimerase family protein [Gemmatimonadaceae bacterium]